MPLPYVQAIRYALRGAGQAMAAQAQPLLTALPEHFASSRQSCYLYAASELVKTFGSNPAYEQALGKTGIRAVAADNMPAMLGSLALPPWRLAGYDLQAAC